MDQKKEFFDFKSAMWEREQKERIVTINSSLEKMMGYILIYKNISSLHDALVDAEHHGILKNDEIMHLEHLRDFEDPHITVELGSFIYFLVNRKAPFQYKEEILARLSYTMDNLFRHIHPAMYKEYNQRTNAVDRILAE